MKNTRQTTFDSKVGEFSKLNAALVQSGLQTRGSFMPLNNDKVPSLDTHTGQTTLILVGNIGSSLWPNFSASDEYQDGMAHPLDRWSKRVGDQLAKDFNGMALYPFDGPPYWPFLTWTKKAEGLIASPLGLNFHPQYGLWHAYRFALLLPFVEDQHTDEPIPSDDAFSCSNCIEQPCLDSCPVNAFDGKNYDTSRCTSYLNSDTNAYCNTHGCLARHGCPVGQEFAYTAQQANFHMQAFKAARNLS